MLRIFFFCGYMSNMDGGPTVARYGLSHILAQPKTSYLHKKMQQASPALATTNAGPPARCPPRSPDPAAALPPQLLGCLLDESTSTSHLRALAAALPPHLPNRRLPVCSTRNTYSIFIGVSYY
jgi:hypothetical protein